MLEKNKSIPTSSPSEFAQKRQTYVKNDLVSGESFEKYLGNILSKLSYLTHFPNSELDVSTENYIKDYSSIKLKLARASDIESKITEIINLYIECSWRSIGYFLRKKTHTGLPLFKYENYIANRPKSTLIIIGHGGNPSYPEKVFVTQLSQFIDFGETIEYELFKGNKAKHSPHQRALHLKHFTICNNKEELTETLLNQINKLKNNKNSFLKTECS